MRLLVRIFNECFLDDEWNVFMTVPDNFGQNIQLDDIVDSRLLKSFAEFNGECFYEALSEESKEKFNEDVKKCSLKHELSKDKSILSVWSDWMNDFFFQVTGRKWCINRKQKEIYLEIWLENK